MINAKYVLLVLIVLYQESHAKHVIFHKLNVLVIQFYFLQVIGELIIIVIILLNVKMKNYVMEQDN